MAYTNKDTVQNYLAINIDACFDDYIDLLIAAAKRYIDNYTGTEFESSDDTYRLYDGSGTNTILTDDFTSITKIELLDSDRDVDTTLNNADDWYLYPENKTTKNKIILDTDADFVHFHMGHQNIKVYGSFAAATTVPADIQMAATKIVASFLSRAMQGGAGNIKSEKLFEYTVSFGDIKDEPDFIDAMEILKLYAYIPIV